MASRKEEKERLRVEREAAEAAEARAERKRLILGYIVAGLISLAVVGGIIFAIVGGGDGGASTGESSENVNYEFGGVLPEGIEVDIREGTEPPPVAEEDLRTAADAAGCELQTDLEDEGNTHLAPTADPPDYGTNPATSGDHAPEPLADGAFTPMPPENYVVHGLEHGRVTVQYSPDLSEDEQLALKGVFDADRPGVLLFPNPDMPYAVAATAWTQMLGCDTYEGEATLDAIRDFIGTYRGRGPEAIPF